MAYIGAKPADRPIQTSDIEDNAITTAKIQNDAIDNTKLDLTSDYAFTGSISGAGGLVKLSETIIAGSSATSIDFTSSVITSTYDSYLFIGMMHPETDNSYIQARLSDGGTFNSGSTDYAWGYVNEGGTGNSSNGDNIIRIIDQQDTDDAGKVACFKLTLFNPQNSSVATNLVWHATRDDGNHAMYTGGGGRLATEASDGIRFFFNSGNISIGSRVTCYGVVK